MAFADIEKTKILFYLGYSVFEDDGPAVRAINGLDAKEARIGWLIRDLLEKMDDLRVQVHKTIPLSKAIEDDKIKLRAHYTLDHIWRIGRGYVNQLANICKVAVVSQIFAASSLVNDPSGFYSGDPSEPRINPTLGVPTR